MKNLSVEKRFGSLVGMALVAVGVALLCSGQVLGGVMWLNGSAYGRYGSGNTTIGEQSVSGVALADDDTALRPAEQLIALSKTS